MFENTMPFILKKNNKKIKKLKENIEHGIRSDPWPGCMIHVKSC